MSFRTDISVYWTYNPRLIIIAAPSTEITIQDLHDTLRVLEQQSWQGLAHPPIIETAGKEPLGAGVTVGLTAKLLNAKLAFQARKTSISSGTITTASVTGTNLIDSTATFITDQVNVGAWVVNLDDGSRASVLRVISETQIETDILGDGTTNQFAVGNKYEINNITQCDVNGGNLVAVTSDGETPMSPILPTAGTQIVRTSSSSATLQELVDIQYASFSGGVSLDETSEFSGVAYPTGTPRQPVNNLVDALLILNERGLSQINVIGNATIGAGDYTGITFYGESRTKTTITIDSMAEVHGCHFINANITGELDGGGLLQGCAIKNLDYVDGFIEDCTLTPGGLITLSGVAVAKFLNCSSGLGVGPAADTAAPEPDEMDLIAWWRATDSGTISSWTDQVGSNHFIQSDALKQPELRTDGPQNTKYFRFSDATGDFMTSTSIPAYTSAFTLFAIIRTSTANGPPTFWEDVLEDGFGLYNTQRGVIVGGPEYSGELLLGSPITESWELWIYTTDGSTYSKLSVNGVNEFTSSEVPLPATDVLFIGGPYSTRNVDIAEIGFTDYEFTIFNEAQLLAYVSEYYGILVSEVPTIDMGNAGSSLAMRNYNGDLLIRNKHGDESINIDVNSGHIVLDQTVTAGNITVRGVGKLTDNSIGAVVDASNLVNPTTISNAVWEESKSSHASTGTFGGDIATKKDIIVGNIVFGK